MGFAALNQSYALIVVMAGLDPAISAAA